MSMAASARVLPELAIAIASYRARFAANTSAMAPISLARSAKLALRSEAPPLSRANLKAASTSSPRVLAVASTVPLTGSTSSVSMPSACAHCPQIKLSSFSGTPILWPPLALDHYLGSDNDTALMADPHCRLALQIPSITITTLEFGVMGAAENGQTLTENGRPRSLRENWKCKYFSVSDHQTRDAASAPAW